MEPLRLTLKEMLPNQKGLIVLSALCIPSLVAGAYLSICQNLPMEHCIAYSILGVSPVFILGILQGLTRRTKSFDKAKSSFKNSSILEDKRCRAAHLPLLSEEILQPEFAESAKSLFKDKIKHAYLGAEPGLLREILTEMAGDASRMDLFKRSYASIQKQYPILEDLRDTAFQAYRESRRQTAKEIPSYFIKSSVVVPKMAETLAAHYPGISVRPAERKECLRYLSNEENVLFEKDFQLMEGGNIYYVRAFLRFDPVSGKIDLSCSHPKAEPYSAMDSEIDTWLAFVQSSHVKVNRCIVDEKEFEKDNYHSFLGDSYRAFFQIEGKPVPLSTTAKRLKVRLERKFLEQIRALNLKDDASQILDIVKECPTREAWVQKTKSILPPKVYDAFDNLFTLSDLENLAELMNGCSSYSDFVKKTNHELQQIIYELFKEEWAECYKEALKKSFGCEKAARILNVAHQGTISPAFEENIKRFNLEKWNLYTMTDESFAFNAFEEEGRIQVEVFHRGFVRECSGSPMLYGTDAPLSLYLRTLTRFDLATGQGDIFMLKPSFEREENLFFDSDQYSYETIA